MNLIDRRRSSIRLAALSLLASALATPALAQKAFVLPHVLERDGSICAIAWDLTGGQEYFDLELDANGQTVVQRRYLYHRALFSLHDNGNMFDVLSNSLLGNEREWNHAIGSLEKGMDVDQIIEVPVVTGIRFPGGDVNSKDPAGVEVSWEAGAKWMRELHVKTKSAARFVAKKQKLWSPANFRLKIGDLPCSKVSKTGKWHTHSPGHKSVNSLRTWTSDDWWFILPLSDAQAFRLGPLRDTMAGAPKELPLRMEYLDEEGNLLLGFDTMVIVLGVDKANPFDPFDPADPANADKPVVVTVRGANALNVFFQR